MLAVTDTCICKACKEIVDVTVGKYGETYSKEEARMKKGKSGFDLDFYVCPNCRSDRNLVKWIKSKRPCPRCDGKMEKDAQSEIMMRDWFTLQSLESYDCTNVVSHLFWWERHYMTSEPLKQYFADSIIPNYSFRNILLH